MIETTKLKKGKNPSFISTTTTTTAWRRTSRTTMASEISEWSRPLVTPLGQAILLASRLLDLLDLLDVFDLLDLLGLLHPLALSIGMVQP